MQIPARLGLSARVVGAVALIAVVGAFDASSAAARTLLGNARANTLRGSSRADVIRGLGGNDRLFGRGGNDRLYGGAGRDRLVAGRGNDVLVGGDGNDSFHCGPGRDRAIVQAGDFVLSDCEVVSRQAPSGSGGGSTAPPSAGGGQPAPSIAGDFSGTLTTTVRYRSVCSGQVIADQTSRIPSRITISPALAPNPADLPADVPERNPFNLILGQTTVAGTTAAGSLSAVSAARFRFSSVRSLILQYWNLAFDGTNLSGTLVQDHREEGAAFNLLAAWRELAPCQPQLGSYVDQLAVAEGATLTGTVTPQQVQLRISGRTIDTFHEFVADIAATRSG
jgi:hypothetical protein